MIDITTLCIILTVHWIADFVFQTSWMSKNKSKAWTPLLVHTVVYTAITLIGWWLTDILFGISLQTVLGVTTTIFISHTAIDYVTSRINLKLWERGKIQGFFTLIGFDQLLHYIQLFLTYYLLVTK